MAWIPDPVSRQHVDEDSDDIFQARQNLHDFGAAINGIRQYLVDLFGVDGTKGTAITTLFSNQAVLFPAGTNMFFYNATVPPGWVKWVHLDQGRYLMAVTDDSGGNYVGDNFVWLQTTPTALVQGHLPSLTLYGFTNWIGDHVHLYRPTRITTFKPSATAFGAAEAGTGDRTVWLDYQDAWTSGSGNHGHSVEVSTGGANWGHDHMVSMANYRPAGLKGVIGSKA